MVARIETGQSHSLSQKRASKRARIDIGLVNNMPDGAVRATERQFQSLLGVSSGGLNVRLHLLKLPEVPRSASALTDLMQDYADAADLGTAKLDGLIITGAEPRTARLQDEIYWRSFTRLIEWAADNTVSTIFSCLAAHAAALHLDGIERRPLGDKLSGIFECSRTDDHPLYAGAPNTWRVPHSRFNELNADDLARRGYQLLALSSQAGVDTFARQAGSLLVFFQGHPEYDGHSLLREYLRDITRFLRGERDRFPGMPTGYLSAEGEAAFARVREQALSGNGAERSAALAAAEAELAIVNTWRAPAQRFYANWLAYIAARKAEYRQAELA